MRSFDLRRIAQLRDRCRSLSNRHHVEIHDVRPFPLKLRRAEKVCRQRSSRELDALDIARMATVQDVQIERHALRLRKTAQEVDVLLLNKEIVISNGDHLIGARSQSEWLDL